ncbi:MAG: hypothetical protein WDO24_31425 [Pseudomonadota bacterium]
MVTATRLFLAILVMAACAPRLQAQSPQPDPKALFAGYVASEQYRLFLETVFNRGEPQPPKDRCASMKVVSWNKYLVLDPPTFVRVNGSYKIETGTWVAGAELNRCGKQVMRRAVLKATPGNNGLDATLLLPGDFRGNLQLEEEADRTVVPSLMTAAKCQNGTTFAVLDIKPSSPVTPQGWSETWTAQACKTIVTAKITYSKTSTGVNIAVSDAKVTR